MWNSTGKVILSAATSKARFRCLRANFRRKSVAIFRPNGSLSYLKYVLSVEEVPFACSHSLEAVECSKASHANKEHHRHTHVHTHTHAHAHAHAHAHTHTHTHTHTQTHSVTLKISLNHTPFTVTSLTPAVTQSPNVQDMLRAISGLISYVYDTV